MVRLTLPRTPMMFTRRDVAPFGTRLYAVRRKRSHERVNFAEFGAK